MRYAVDHNKMRSLINELPSHVANVCACGHVTSPCTCHAHAYACVCVRVVMCTCMTVHVRVAGHTCVLQL